MPVLQRGGIAHAGAALRNALARLITAGGPNGKQNDASADAVPFRVGRRARHRPRALRPIQ